MKKSVFDEFYNKTVLPIAQAFIKEHTEFVLNDSPDAVYEEYLNQKKFTRLLYNKRSIDAETKSLLDRHKICACVTIAIVHSRLIYTRIEDDNSDSLSNMNRVNEQLAFLASWELLKAFIRKRHTAEDSSDMFQLPPTFHNDSFTDTITRSLYYANTTSGLCVPLLSNIYYLLEMYCEKGTELEGK